MVKSRQGQQRADFALVRAEDYWQPAPIYQLFVPSSAAFLYIHITLHRSWHVDRLNREREKLEIFSRSPLRSRRVIYFREYTGRAYNADTRKVLVYQRNERTLPAIGGRALRAIRRIAINAAAIGSESIDVFPPDPLFFSFAADCMLVIMREMFNLFAAIDVYNAVPPAVSRFPPQVNSTRVKRKTFLPR